MRETLPGHPEYTIVRRDRERVELLYEGERSPCGGCGAALHRVGKTTRMLYDVPRGFTPQHLEVTLQLWRCPNGCPAPRGVPGLTVPTEGSRRQRNLTARLEAYLKDAWGRGEAVRTLARQVGMDEERLYALIHAWAPDLHHAWRTPEMLRGLQYVGIDEFFWRQQELVVVMNIAPGIKHRRRKRQVNTVGRVIDILPTRDTEAVEAFLHDLREAKRRLGEPDWRPVIATDMWEAFRLAIRRVFRGDAIHVADRFHITAKIVEELQEAFTLLLLRGRSGDPGAGALSRTERQDVRDLASRLHKSYAAALKTRGEPDLPEDVPPDLRAPVKELINAARFLHLLWLAQGNEKANQDPPTRARYLFQAWLRTVRKWQGEYRVKAFGRLITLLDDEGWLLELTNALRPEARPVLEHIQDPGQASKIQARPGVARLTSTARVEATNSLIRRQEGRSPNHRRVPAKGRDWTGWREEELFERYRARLLYALNTPPPERPTLSSRLLPEVSPCPDCMAPASAQQARGKGVDRWAWDVPLAHARVQSWWTAQRMQCRACEAHWTLDVSHEGRVTARLHDHLVEALRRDETVHAMQQRTGVSRERLVRLRESLPEVAHEAPANIGALSFLWRGRLRLALFDVVTGRPFELLPDGSQEALTEWLASAAARPVRHVWVERPDWLPAEPDGRIWALDPFTAARIFQQAVQALARDITAGMNVSRLRAPPMRRLRRVLTMNAQARRPPLAYRLEREHLTDLRRRIRREHPEAAHGQTLIALLKWRLRREPEEAVIDAWLAEVEGLRRSARLNPARQRTVRALSLITRHLQPGSVVRAALLAGYRASPRATPARNEERGERLNLARARRRMKDLRGLRVYRGGDWTHLRAVTLTVVGR